jgi:hypothetical protein
MNEYNVPKREHLFAVKNKEKKEIVLDLNINIPSDEVTPIPVDTRTIAKRYEEFIEQVKNQKFLVFMREAEEYFNNTTLNIKEVQNPMIRSRLENELNIRIAGEKSGMKEDITAAENTKEVKSTLITAELENDLRLKILNEKSGFKEVSQILNDSSKSSDYNNDFAVEASNYNFDRPVLKVPIEKFSIKFNTH